VVYEMLDGLTALNSFVGDFETLARPSAEACRWCSYKAACAPFFASVRPDWDLRDRCVLGTVDELDVDAAAPCFTLRATAGNLDLNATQVVVLVSEAAALEGISVGATVAVAGASPTRSPSTIRCEWDTVLCIWESEPVGTHTYPVEAAV
jgi:hypothetical protein